MNKFGLMLLLLFGALSVESRSQSVVTTGVVRGVTRDSSGALIADAMVILLARNTGESSLRRTNDAGLFVFPSQPVGNYRLDEATVYVTLEPCAMCAGALVEARVRRLVFGARHLRFGGVRSKFRIADSELLNHRVEIVEGVLALECLELLQDFFRLRRAGPAASDRP